VFGPKRGLKAPIRELYLKAPFLQGLGQPPGRLMLLKGEFRIVVDLER